MTSRRQHKSSPALPQGQRPGPIPAWASGPGNRHAENKRAEGPSHEPGRAPDESGLQPLVRMETVPWAVGPGCYVTAPLALRRQPQSSAMTSRRQHKPRCACRASVLSDESVSDWLALARFFAQGRGEHGRSADFQSAVSPTSSRQSAAVTSTPEVTTNAPVRPTPGGLETRDTADWKSAPPSFHAQWLALRGKHPEVFTVSADEIDAWHRHEAWRCESRQDWSNAVAHLSALLETHPDSGDFLPRRAAAHVAWAESLLSLAPGFNPVTTNGVTTPAASAASRPPEAVETAPDRAATNTGLKPGANEIEAAARTSATNHLQIALADYARTLAWVDRYPALAQESRKPFVEKRREVYLKLGRKSEADADERELKAGGTTDKQKKP